jgi:hypothetical protein
MLLDDTVNGLAIVQPQNIYIDENIINIKGKIGETTNLRKRINGYKNSQHNGM